MSAATLSSPVNKLAQGNLVNRQQLEILRALLPTVRPDPPADAYGTIYIGDLPRTGAIIDAIGLVRSPKAYASVSRSLARLEANELVVSFSGLIFRQGKGRSYQLTAKGLEALDRAEASR
jgi:hypothetical protein